MLKLQGLFSTKWEYHLSITTPETPSYTPKNKKSSSLRLAIIIGDDATCMG